MAGRDADASCGTAIGTGLHRRNSGGPATASKPTPMEFDMAFVILGGTAILMGLTLYPFRPPQPRRIPVRVRKIDLPRR